MGYRIQFQGETIEVEEGQGLRKALLKAGLSPHNGQAELLNCRGFGTCGTCAIEVEGPVEPPEPKNRERLRMSFYPHDPSSGLRLACQCRVKGDLKLTKHGGFWGEKLGC
ncbi:MAG: 2Fe-2S iron-sulfur cluster-binding protein [Myxococcota bacterium]